MTIGKSITYVSKEVLIKLRDVIDGMIENYIEYEYGSIEPDKKNNRVMAKQKEQSFKSGKRHKGKKALEYCMQPEEEKDENF